MRVPCASLPLRLKRAAPALIILRALSYILLSGVKLPPPSSVASHPRLGTVVASSLRLANLNDWTAHDSRFLKTCLEDEGTE